MCLASAETALADAFYCGTSTVRDGMSAAAILERCGQPDRLETVEEPVFTRLDNGATVQTGTDTREIWYYDRGPNQFVARIVIRDSIAAEVELLQVRGIDSLVR
jgi:hypothetical protein